MNKGKNHVVVSLFREGAAQWETLHESFNMASAWRLPIDWVCENDMYFITTHVKDSLAAESIDDFGGSYNMPSTTVNGMEVLTVAEVVMLADLFELPILT